MVEKIEDSLKEINELTTTIVGKINNLDSRKVRADVVSEVVNGILANAELSKIEKAGLMAYLMDKRIKG